MPGSELLVLAVSRRTTEFLLSLMDFIIVGSVNKLTYMEIGVHHLYLIFYLIRMVLILLMLIGKSLN